MKNVLEFIERSAEKYPDKLSVADINGGLTYKELEQTAKQIGAWLYQRLGGCRTVRLSYFLIRNRRALRLLWELCTVGTFMWL